MCQQSYFRRYWRLNDNTEWSEEEMNKYVLSSYELAVVEAIRSGASIYVWFFNRKDSRDCEEALEPFSHLGLPMHASIEDGQQVLRGYEQIRDVSHDGEHSVNLGFLNYCAMTKRN